MRPACTGIGKLPDHEGIPKPNRWLSVRYCRHIGLDPVQHWQMISDLDETIRFLYGFFSWRCDIRRGSISRYWTQELAGVVLEVGSGLSKGTIIKVQDVSNRPHARFGQ
jgi:hypothetical protein